MAAQYQLRWNKDWGKMTTPTGLTDQEWGITSVLGVVLLVMALLQLIGFGVFRDWLSSVGFSGPAVWAVVIIVAEVWAAFGFFKLPLMNGFRAIGAWLTILVSGFWFIENMRLVSEGQAGVLANSGFFGKFLTQSPGWWTAVEVTVLLLWVVYSLRLTAWSNNR